jgi:predicted transcriptional regulator
LEGQINEKYYGQTQLKNWIKLHFQIDGLKFEQNTKSIVFYPPGFGYTAEESIANAKTKAVKIKEHLEAKHKCKLSFPKFYVDTQHPHFVPITTTPENLVNMQETIFTDLSHPGAIETESKDFVNKIVKTQQKIEEFDKVKDKINEIDQLLKSNQAPIQNDDFNKKFDFIFQKLEEINSRIEKIAVFSEKTVNIMSSAIQPAKPNNEREPTAPYIN